MVASFLLWSYRDILVYYVLNVDTTDQSVQGSTAHIQITVKTTDSKYLAT